MTETDEKMDEPEFIPLDLIPYSLQEIIDGVEALQKRVSKLEKEGD